MWGRSRSFGLFWAVALCLLSTLSHARDEGLRGARVIEGSFTREGELLLAGPEGVTLAIEHGARLRAEPGTTFRFHKFMKLPMRPAPDPMVPARVLSIELGTITTSIPEDKRYAVLMNGPRKLRAIAIEGRATLIAAEAHATVANLEGKLLVTIDEKWRHMSAGGVQLVSRAYPAGLRRNVLGAPALPALSRRLLLEGGGESGMSTLTWPALTGAVQYDVEISSEGVAPTRQRTRARELSLGPFAAGNYRVAVRGIDDSGLPGALSEPVLLNVVGLEIPKTASRAPSGAVRLQPGQRVGLVGAEGLEVGYLGFEEFLPAPKTLGLVARRPISTLLRHPQSGETVRLELEPMTVRAEISFERHPHTWPEPGLPIRVRLIDDKGYPIPDEFEVSCRVTVNVRPTEPVWRRSGPTLHTLLPEPEGSGPWMVRVEVLDQSGSSLGMDFSEVAYEPAPTEQRQTRR